MSVIADMKEEVVLQNSKLDNMIKSVRMLNKGSTVLDEILQTGKNAENVRGLGYAYQAVKNQGEKPEVKFVPAKKEQEKNMSNHMFQHHQRHQKRYNRGRNQKWRCTHCGRLGHLKPYCYKLCGYPKFVPQPRRKQIVDKKRKGGIPKNGISKEIAHTSLKASAREY